MASLVTQCEEHFHCSSLYDVLGVSKRCKAAELRKAFYKMSLLHHPDKHIGAAKVEATARFQILSKIYSILSDTEKRKVYDETGVVDEDESIASKSYDDWVTYWQLIFPRVTTEKIDEFCAKYKDSQQELDDLAEIYERFKGDMDSILETLLFASYTDESRIRKLIDQLIASGRVKAYGNYTKEDPAKVSKRAKRALKEEQLFNQEQLKLSKRALDSASKESEDSLILAIKANRERHLQSTENLLDRLTEKYCKPPAPKKPRAKKR
ncbi:unnamed protein product [Dicrocoelium dendriticum]|nr:unnamed protein product [Dicrocoelium dendriticum]